MGGYGSGRRWLPDAKKTTDEFPALDIRELKNLGLFGSDRILRYDWKSDGQGSSAALVRPGEGCVEVYSLTNTDDDAEEVSPPRVIPLVKSICNYGGTRSWFCCPQCSRRVAVLYISAHLACRHCLALKHRSQREVAYLRAVRRAKKINARLGGSGDMGSAPAKPKGMWWRTYQRLVNDCCMMKRKALLGISMKLGIEV